MTDPARMSDDAMAQVEAWRLLQDALRIRNGYRTQFVITGFSALTVTCVAVESWLRYWGVFYWTLFSTFAIALLCIEATYFRRLRQAEAYVKTRQVELERLEDGP